MTTTLDRWTRLALVLALTLATTSAEVSAAPGTKQPAPTPSLEPRIVNGERTHDFATAGALLLNGFGECSGTLIGCSTFLTAAHCLEGLSGQDVLQVYLQDAGIFGVAAYWINPDYFATSGARGDIGVVRLSSAVTGIRPTPLSATYPPVGHGGTIVGFGVTSGTGDNFGNKRKGPVTIADCRPDLHPRIPSDEPWLVCWNYTGTQADTCYGDSGGPLYMNFGAGFVVSGVTVGGTTNCVPTDHSWDTSVYQYNSWVRSVAWPDNVDAVQCGAIPQVGDRGMLVFNEGNDLSSTNGADRYVYNISPTNGPLRVTLNGKDTVDFGLDMYVAYNRPAQTYDADCYANDFMNFEQCIFNSPPAGNWYILVKRAFGSGHYQLTTTAVGCAAGCC